VNAGVLGEVFRWLRIWVDMRVSGLSKRPRQNEEAAAMILRLG
jgi:hypothetical protein